MLSSLLLLRSSAETLRQAFDRHHTFVGAAASGPALKSDSAYASVLAQQFNLITSENDCKWGAIRPSQNQYDYSGCDFAFNFARQANQTFRGHNLCWGEYNPGWLTSGQFSPTQKRQILQEHVTNVVKHYGSRLYAWDVVNEALSDGGDMYKSNVWYPDVPDYIEVAFKAARAAEPNVKLFYNDYNVESATGWSQGKSDKMYNLVKDLKQKGVPIDGVGLQMHIDIYWNLFDGVRQNIRRYEQLGIEVHITEMDVGCVPYGQQCPSWGPSQEQQQAEVYKQLLQICLEFPRTCRSYQSWGYTDRYSWRDGQHSLPFNEQLGAKQAVGAMLSVL